MAFMRANLRKPAMTAGRTPSARVLWEISASGMREVSFSPSGRFVCTVAGNSQISCYDLSGTRKFATVVSGADSAVVSGDGNCVLAYSRLNRLDTHLTFLDEHGKSLWQMKTSGAVWSADAADAEGEACFAVGTGARYVYLINIQGASRRYRRWRAPGAVCSVSFSRDGEELCYGTWQRSSVSRSDLAGHKEWELDVGSADLHHVQSLLYSDRMFVRATPNRSGAEGEGWFTDADGTPAGRLPLSAGSKTCVLPSPDGLYVCAGYTESIRHSAKTTPEKHVALYDCDGDRLWDKGSLLFPYTAISILQGGYVLVAGKNGILAISPAGEAKQICKLPAGVMGAISSRDGLRAMLFCADGRLRFLQVSP